MQTISSLPPVELKVDQALNMGSNEKSANSTMFEQILDSISSMENTQVQAKTDMADVLSGKSDDSHGALIELQQAELQMSFAASVRDKVVQGVNQLFNMQI
ncbi:flagellar hook-basal body complex protein FliE [Bacillus mexicanus]|uniref:flagellar hook-basal body complex protein FliE n=1 Tax=Bacillus mexicanus TaxID=2834415 RepID=UPI003D24D229